jgi:hypothetical protein
VPPVQAATRFTGQTHELPGRGTHLDRMKKHELIAREMFKVERAAVLGVAGTPF